VDDDYDDYYDDGGDLCSDVFKKKIIWELFVTNFLQIFSS